MNCVSNIRKKLSDFTRISKDDFYVCALAAFISCFFAISIRGFISSLNENTLIVNLINNVREEWYMNTFYSDINSSNNAKERIPDIVIVDIKPVPLARLKVHLFSTLHTLFSAATAPRPRG